MPRNSSRNSTPSVSPLSNTSGPREDGNTKPESEVVPVNGSEPSAGDLGQRAASPAASDDGASSSLSEFDGSLDEHDKMDAEDTPRQAAEEGNESEAETERLGRTPQKLWKTGETGRTPSKLSQQANTYDDEASDGDSTPTARQRASVSPSTRASKGNFLSFRWKNSADHDVQMSQGESANVHHHSAMPRAHFPTSQNPTTN